MFDPKIEDQTAAIMLGAVYTALSNPTTDKQLAYWIIDGVQKYIGNMTTQKQIEMRLLAISIALKTAPRFIVTDDSPITRTEAEWMKFLTKKTYSVPIIRKIHHAITACTEASDKELYFGVIQASKEAVFVAMLPWMWGWLNWTWEFRPKPTPSAQRDYFMLATN